MSLVPNGIPLHSAHLHYSGNAKGVILYRVEIIQPEAGIFIREGQEGLNIIDSPDNFDSIQQEL